MVNPEELPGGPRDVSRHSTCVPARDRRVLYVDGVNVRREANVNATEPKIRRTLISGRELFVCDNMIAPATIIRIGAPSRDSLTGARKKAGPTCPAWRPPPRLPPRKCQTTASCATFGASRNRCSPVSNFPINAPMSTAASMATAIMVIATLVISGVWVPCRAPGPRSTSVRPP